MGRSVEIRLSKKDKGIEIEEVEINELVFQSLLILLPI